MVLFFFLKEFKIVLDLELTPNDIIGSMKNDESALMEETYSISEVAKRFGYTADTLRYYEKEELLPHVMRRGGKRVFTATDIHTLGVISCLKKTGMPLVQIAEYIRLCQTGDSTVPARLALFQERRQAIRAELEELQKCADLIDYKVWYYEVAAKEGVKAVADREATMRRYCKETGRSSPFQEDN